MAVNLPARTCGICGKEKPCTTVMFYPSGDKALPAPYTGTAGVAPANQFPMYCCEDCGRERGTAAKTPWILILIGYVLLIGAIVLVSLPKSVTGLEPSSGWPIIPMMAGWMLTVFAPMALIFKMRNEMSGGAMVGLVFLQFLPVIGLIALLAKAGQINRCTRAVSALKPAAGEHVLAEKRKDEELTRLAESGAELTEAQKQEIAEHEKEKKVRAELDASARAAQEERVNRGNYRGAILGIVITVFLAIWGISTYSSGRGYMTFFGIELSSGGFIALICAFLVWDVISLINAKKKM